MSNKSKRKPPNGWARQQAVAQKKAQERKVAQLTEQQGNEATAKQVFTELITQWMAQQGRLQRLSEAFADRCWRVHELSQQAKAEWERAEAAEAKVRELQAQLNRPPAKRNGSVKKSVPVS